MITNHSNSPYDPDEQALLDFGDRVASGTDRQPKNDLEETVLRVDTSLSIDTSASAAMPGELRAQIWENIMTTIPMPEAAASANPWTPPETTGVRKSQRIHPQPAQPAQRAPMPRMAWSRAANLALALVLLLAGFGAFRAFEVDLPFGDRGSDTPGGGQYAQAPIIATPAATAVPSNAASACDFSRSVLI